MEKERANKLIKYLYPTEQIRSFMCNDLYIELNKIIKRQICISTKNIVSSVRQENLVMLKHIINNFIEVNTIYKQKINELYGNGNMNGDIIINEIIVGYVFYIANSVPKYVSMDIFRDKRSVVYSPISMIDIL